MGLSERHQVLFQTLMQLYLSEGKPVASKQLAEASYLGVSSATIRNALADLEKMGLLYAPHTSAGRVPTDRGVRFFVDSFLHLDEVEAESQESALLKGVSQLITPSATQDETLSKAVEVLSGLTGLAGVVLLPNKAEEVFTHIEFVPLNEMRVLVVLVFNQQDVQNRVIELKTPISASELQQIANYLNQHFAGQTLQQARRFIHQQMAQMQQQMQLTMQAMMQVTDEVLAVQLKSQPPLVIKGKTKLVNYQELADAEKLRTLFEAFEEHSSMLELLDKSLQAKGLQIFIGRECGVQAYQECSVVTMPYEVEGEFLGVFGVVGPMRMPYDKVAKKVRVTAQAVSQALAKG